ncbi:hypothetical protein, partial [Bacteroides stercoris]
LRYLKKIFYNSVAELRIFFIFPLFGLFATSGMIFSASKGGRNNLARLKRKNTLTSGEEDFCTSLAAECRH